MCLSTPSIPAPPPPVVLPAPTEVLPPEEEVVPLAIGRAGPIENDDTAEVVDRFGRRSRDSVTGVNRGTGLSVPRLAR